MKGKVRKTAILFDLHTAGLRRRQEVDLVVAEMKMVRFSLGVTRMDNTRNE